MATSITYLILPVVVFLGLLVQSEGNRPEPPGLDPKPFGSVQPCNADEPGQNCPIAHVPENPAVKGEPEPFGSIHQGPIEPENPHKEGGPEGFLEPEHLRSQDESSHAEPGHPQKPEEPRPNVPQYPPKKQVQEPGPWPPQVPHGLRKKPEDSRPIPIIHDPKKPEDSRPAVPNDLTKHYDPLKPTGHQDPFLPGPRPVGASKKPDNGTQVEPVALNVDLRSEQNDAHNLQVALNLEYLEAEFFLNSVFGEGLDKIAPYLVEGGPLPEGAQKAELDSLTLRIIFQFALQEIGHLRAIKKTLGKYYFGRPQLNISKQVFADFIDRALGEKLNPPFDVYANPINYFIGVYIIPYVGLTGYVGTSQNLLTPAYKRRVAGLLAVEAGQDAVTRQYLFERMYDKVAPYGFTVAEFTNKISALRNKLSHDGDLDEGLVVPQALGAEGVVVENIISADVDSLAYGRTPAQVFSTVYGTGDAKKPGGFYPLGAKGKIAEELLAA